MKDKKKDFIASTKKKLLGLKAKVALRESLIVTVAAIFIFINTGFDPNSLLLIPVFCVIITCTISVWTAILNGVNIVYSTLISSLYIYAVFFSIPHHIYWVSFIILFIFTYIIAATSIGRRWFNALSVKKIIIDIIVLLYFSPRGQKSMQIWHNLVISIMIGGSIIIVGLIVQPQLATRLFKKKIVKTLNSTRIFFRGVGYQMEVSAAHNIEDENTLKENNSFCFPIFPVHDDHSIENNNDNRILESVLEDYDIITEENGDINLSPINRKHNNDNIDNNNQTTVISPPPPQTIIIDIPSEQPLSLPNEQKQQVQIEQQQQNEDINTININDDSSNNNSEVSNDSSNTKTEMKKNKSFKKLRHALHSITHLHTNSDDSSKSSGLPLSRMGAMERDLFTKKMSKKNIIATAVPLPDEKELQQWENKLTNEINRLGSLLAECRQERWNSKLITSYEKLLSLLEMNQNQLISIKLSVNQGFSQGARQEVIFPVLPFLDSIIEEVFLQIGLIIHILVHSITREDTAQDSQLYISILQQSFEETEALVLECRNTYKQIVREYQRNNLPTLPATEVTKVHFFIFGISLFALNQKQIAENVYAVNKESRTCHPSLEIIQYGFPYILMAFPNYFLKRVKLAIAYTKQIHQTQLSERIPTLFQWITQYFYRLWFINKKWKFPLQLAVALTSSIAIFYYFEGRTYNELVVHGIWVCATVVLVMSPSLGATITRGFHRIIGTIIGAILGFLISWAVHEAPHPAKEIILEITTFIIVFISSFVQQDVRFSYAGAVAALTFMIISYGGLLATKFTHTLAVERAFNVALGIIWVLIISIILFPYFTFKNSRLKFFDITSNMSDTFIKIVELGLPPTGNDVSQTDREKTKVEIATSLRQIRGVMAQQKSLLFDIRSELALRPSKSSAHFFKLIGDLSKLYTRLVAFDNAFDYKFSNEMVEAMSPIKQSINDLIGTMIRSIRDLGCLMNDKERQLEFGTKSLSDCLLEMDIAFQDVRHDLLQRKILFNLHPEMIQFGSGMYSLRDFIKVFIIVLKDFEAIKSDQFEHQNGRVKKRFINILCDC